MKAFDWLRQLGRVAAFLAFYLAELVHSGVQVAADVITPRLRARPALIRVPLLARTDTELLVVCNLISLTPGTLVVDLVDGQRTLLVHAMFADDPAQVGEDLRRLEARVLRLLRGGARAGEGDG